MDFYGKEVIILLDFIKWCEDSERTEWMGFHGCKERVLKDYVEYLKEQS